MFQRRLNNTHCIYHLSNNIQFKFEGEKMPQYFTYQYMVTGNIMHSQSKL